MSDDATMAEAVDTSPVDSIQAPQGTSAELSTNQAAKMLAELRWKRDNPAESADAATAGNESEAQAEDAAPAEGTTAEGQEAEPALPAIEPPRSWSKEAHERWSKLDRETQEFLASRDSEDQKAIKRSLQEAAETRKAAEAEQVRWKQERESYVQKQTAYTQALETALQNEFGDIREIADVRKMQAEDPFRFQQWQLRQMELAQAQAERQANEQLKTQEKQSKRSTYEAEQNKRLVELVPEMAEPTKAAVLRERAVAMLNDDLGLSNDQLGRWMQDDTGHEILSNAGIQKLMADGLKYRDLLKAPKAVAAKPVPPVQRPGISSPPGAAKSQDLRNLTQKLETSGSVKDAVELLLARRKAS